MIENDRGWEKWPGISPLAYFLTGDFPLGFYFYRGWKPAGHYLSIMTSSHHYNSSEEEL